MLMTHIVIPYEYNEMTVTALGAGLFNEDTALTEVILPNTIKTISLAAFYGCVNLTSITIPDSVTFIADNAFNGCDKVVISCDAGSYAEQYAIENGIKYKSKAVYVDKAYDPNSTNAQSGKAVAEAIRKPEYSIVQEVTQTWGILCYPNEGINRMTIEPSAYFDDGNTVEFVMPSISDDVDGTERFHQILVQVDITTDVSISWGTSTFFNGEIPDIGIGKYDFIFEWDGTTWCAGAIEKGVVL
jgi:hypothetical protein